MRVLVCGGRGFNDYDKMVEVFDDLFEDYDTISEIIEGGARGADRLAQTFGAFHEIPVRTFSADWERYGKAAGYIRNQQMLDEGKPDLVIAFPGGKGTAMMVKIAQKAGVETILIE